MRTLIRALKRVPVKPYEEALISGNAITVARPGVVWATVKGLGEGQGEAQIHAKGLLALLGMGYRYSISGNTVLVAEAELPGELISDFLRPPKVEGEVVARIKAGELAKGLERVAHLTATEKWRGPLMGVLVKVKEAGLSLTASDGWVLGSTGIRTFTAGEAKSVLKTEGVKVLIPILKALGDEEMEIALSGELAAFHTPTLEVVIAQEPGDYSDWERLIPKRAEAGIIVQAEALRRLLREVRPAYGKREHTWRLRIKVEKHGLTATAMGEHFTLTREVSGVPIAGVGWEGAFNASLLERLIKGLEGDITLDLNRRVAGASAIRAEGFLGLVAALREA